MYPNILSEFSGSVWLTSEVKAFDIQRFVTNAVVRGEKTTTKAASTSGVKFYGASDGKQVAVVDLHGTLTKRANMMQQFSGGTSTEQLAATFHALRTMRDVKAVVLNVDSPGGEAKGVAEAAQALSRLRSAKTVYTVVNETMASGAYWIGSAADRVFVTPTSETGSIGVYIMHVDQTEQMKKDGTKITMIREGEFKAMPNGIEPLDETGVKLLRTKTRKYYQEFVTAIATNRNISMEQAEQLADGRTHIGDDAVSIGLADEVATLEEVVERAAQEKVTLEPAAAQVEDVQIDAQALSAELEAARAELESAHAAFATLKAEFEALGESNTSLQEELTEIRAARLMDEFSCKFAPEQDRSKWLQMAKTDLDGARELLATLSDVEPPFGSVLPEETPLAREDEGKPVATSDAIAEFYTQLGIEFIRA